MALEDRDTKEGFIPCFGWWLVTPREKRVVSKVPDFFGPRKPMVQETRFSDGFLV